MVGARRLARPRLPGSKPGGSAIPREPRAERMASLTGFAPVISCMRGRHVGWTTPQGLPKAPNPKIQIPKKFQIPIFKLRNAWFVGVYYQQLWIGLLKIWCLELGVWLLELS